MEKLRPVTVDPAEGVTVTVVGDTYRILVGGGQTRGAFTVIDMLIPPGGGPGPHSHANIEESFYVIDGEITVRSEYGTYQAGKGAFVNIPKGVRVCCRKGVSFHVCFGGHVWCAG